MWQGWVWGGVGLNGDPRTLITQNLQLRLKLWTSDTLGWLFAHMHLFAVVVCVVEDSEIIAVYLFSPSLPPVSHSNSRPSRLWSRASSSVVLKVCLCCYALWLGCQLTPTDLSQKADCRGIPITLPRPNPLSSLWHLSPFCQFPPLLLSSPFWSWQQRHPQGPPWCETHSWSFSLCFCTL